MKLGSLVEPEMLVAINDCLADLLTEKASTAQFIDPVYHELLQTITQLVARGGKRLRPQLALLAYHGMEGKHEIDFLPIAASQELFHAFILIHDDIIDCDITRWGGPNISGVYRKKLQSQCTKSSPAEQRHWADSYALLAGDLCLSLSQSAILDAPLDPALKVSLLQLVQQTLFTMIGGELLDVATALPAAQPPSRQQILNISRYKTAAYSFIAPLQLGALAAGATAKQLATIADFGNNLGIAYQLQDDILGMFGDPAKTGKSTLSDLQQGKHTLLVDYALQQMTTEQTQLVNRWFRNPQADKKALHQIQTIFRKSGALKATETELKNYLSAARTALPNLPFDKTTKQKLQALATNSRSRTN